jgi:hypothetical protein
MGTYSSQSQLVVFGVMLMPVGPGEKPCTREQLCAIAVYKVKYARGDAFFLRRCHDGRVAVMTA